MAGSGRERREAGSHRPSPAERGTLGRCLAHFRIDERIGAGGMGEVYRATDLALERPADALRVAEKDLEANHPWIGAAWDRLNKTTYATLKGMWVW